MTLRTLEFAANDPPAVSPRERESDALRVLARYRDLILGGCPDHDILTLAGGGRKAYLWLMPSSHVERSLSRALGRIERERYGRFVPEWAVEPHNTLVRAFAIHVATRGMPLQ